MGLYCLAFCLHICPELKPRVTKNKLHFQVNALALKVPADTMSQFAQLCIKKKVRGKRIYINKNKRVSHLCGLLIILTHYYNPKFIIY